MDTQCLPWPYAAKAIVQHEFEIDHLNVWVTFRHAMDIEDSVTHVPIKPPDALWLLEVDDVIKPVTVSAWQDRWTLLLTAPNVNSAPYRVLLEYDGPHLDLRISWHKQWEPWGPILSLNIGPSPLVVLYNVTGAPDPDCKCNYCESGSFNGYPCYRRIDGAYEIWAGEGGAGWAISIGRGITDPGYWWNATPDVVGVYDQAVFYTGVPVVSAGSH